MEPCNNCLVVHVEYLDTRQSTTIFQVIGDNAFKLAKHTKGVHVDLFAEGYAYK